MHRRPTPSVRARLERELTSEGVEALAARLTAEAPLTAARTDLRNPRRVVRALEIVPCAATARRRPPSATAAGSCAST
jgi:tRNA A37 N6-isopentenylltransferase MiaA